MKLGFLYAGQGSQRVGMGRDLYEQYPAFRTVFDSASLSFDLKSVCFDGPEEILNQTRYTQPCMVAFAAGVTAVLREQGITPDIAAGLSLGEYSALYAAGVFNAMTAIELVAFRGEAMEKASAGIDCAMMAVLGIARGPLLEACREARSLGVVEISNYNCPGQLVLGGETAAVEAAAKRAMELGAKRCRPLKVSGPFHTPLLSPAGDALRERFQTVHFGVPQIPVVFNCLGAQMSASDTIPALLEKQVQSSVYMEDSIRAMAAAGVDAFVEIGPGKVLSGFVRKTTPEIPAFAVDNAEDLMALPEKLASVGKEHV